MQNIDFPWILSMYREYKQLQTEIDLAGVAPPHKVEANHIHPLSADVTWV